MGRAASCTDRLRRATLSLSVGRSCTKVVRNTRPHVSTYCYVDDCELLFVGVAVTGGVRYILTGFCAYDTEPTHEAYAAEYDARWDGKACADGVHTGDLLRGVFVHTEGGYEMLVPTEGMAVETLYHAVRNSSKERGDDLCVIIERLPELQRGDEHENSAGSGAKEGDIAPNQRNVYVDYLRDNSQQVLGQGNCWSFDDLLKLK